jgi:hypothetical protein
MALAREHFKKRSRPQRRPDDAGEASVRERILSAAFMERGYSGASTLEIATRAKVSKCRASAIALQRLANPPHEAANLKSQSPNRSRAERRAHTLRSCPAGRLLHSPDPFLNYPHRHDTGR